MRLGTANEVVLGAAAQNLLRILIASYFLAAALQLIPGTDLTPLTAPFVPAPLAPIVAAGMVFILAYLVMIGVWMRGAALLLGLMTFFASYLKMIELGLEEELGSFWRDLALIAALMLTYAEHGPGERHLRRALRRNVAPRRIRPSVARAADGTVQKTPRPKLQIPLPSAGDEPVFASRRAADAPLMGEIQPVMRTSGEPVPVPIPVKPERAEPARAKKPAEANLDFDPENDPIVNDLRHMFRAAES